MSMSHTPAPWGIYKLSKDSDPQERSIITANDNEDEVCGIIGNEADARIIKLAPQMLDALIEIAEDLARVKGNEERTDLLLALESIREMAQNRVDEAVPDEDSVAVTTR
jgi:hypothetical protein